MARNATDEPFGGNYWRLFAVLVLIGVAIDVLTGDTGLGHMFRGCLAAALATLAIRWWYRRRSKDTAQ